MSRLYNVAIAFEVIVVAESQDDAERIARDELGDIVVSDDPFISSSAVTAHKGKPVLPMGYDDNCYPYGGGGQDTVAEIWSQREPTEAS